MNVNDFITSLKESGIDCDVDKFEELLRYSHYEHISIELNQFKDIPHRTVLCTYYPKNEEVNIATELEPYRYVGDSNIVTYGIYFCRVRTVDNNDEFKRRLSDLKQKN